MFKNKETIIFTVTSRIIDTGVVRDIEIKYNEVKDFLSNENEYPLWFKILDSRGWNRRSIGCVDELMELFPELSLTEGVI